MRRFPLQQLTLAGLLAGSGLTQAGADAPFGQATIDNQDPGKACRILEFVCATCGHITDSENWDEQNRWRADVERCEQARQANLRGK